MALFSRDVGNQYESEAQRFLEKQNIVLIEANYHCRHGEIDLIMKDEDFIVFIEVKYRKDANHGAAAEMVTPAKQKKIIRTAQHFLMCNPRYQNFACRFDVIAFDGDNAHSINWLRSAFIE